MILAATTNGGWVVDQTAARVGRCVVAHPDATARLKTDRQAATRTPQPPLFASTEVEFAGQVALQGYALGVTPEQVRLDLVWLARAEMEASYKVFVHIIDDTGRLWTQADSRPLQYASNTNRWPPGHLVLDRHELPLPVDMSAGRYQVRLGLYNEADGQRLPVVDAQGVPVDGQVLLAYVPVGQ